VIDITEIVNMSPSLSSSVPVIVIVCILWFGGHKVVGDHVRKTSVLPHCVGPPDPPLWAAYTPDAVNAKRLVAAASTGNKRFLIVVPSFFEFADRFT
jgi:hypothetical protein